MLSRAYGGIHHGEEGMTYLLRKVPSSRVRIRHGEEVKFIIRSLLIFS
jgi:hypothetical protein